MDIPISAGIEARDGLALALVAASSVPLLLLDGALAVVAVSDSFCATFDIDTPPAAGTPLSGLGAGEWDIPQFASLLRATAAGFAEVDAYEMDLERPGRVSCRLVIDARRLEHGDAGNVLLIVSIADVTSARIAEKLREDLLREKEILLRELQHRVANSLQIIASVLMQSAKKVRSEDARGHLRDARNRVMSIATMQRQLAVTRLGEVALDAYFTELCDSIGASMIRDPKQLSLEVSVDGSTARADISTSLGLIVTELVINALKHAFPRHRHGKILVDYRSGGGTAWTLNVTDTGIGMPVDPADARPGLGTGIVEALARQLDATVRIAPANPGTSVSIVHP